MHPRASRLAGAILGAWLRVADRARPPLWRECGGAGHDHHDAADHDDGSDHHHDAAGDDHDDGADDHDDSTATTTTTRPRPTTTTSHPHHHDDNICEDVLELEGLGLGPPGRGHRSGGDSRGATSSPAPGGRARAVDWRRSVLPAVTAAELARELVMSLTPTRTTRNAGPTSSVQVDQAVAALERAADSAPDEASHALCSRCAESLRGLAFAVEADHLMRSGGGHPTGDQLAAADAARRNRSAELDAALRDLKAAITPTQRPG